MNNEIETSLLISLVVLIAVIAFIVWWYGVRRGGYQDASKPRGSFTPPGYKDKLTLIDGIGETLEGKLNKLGITSFRQIAELSERDIERVNAELRFKGRIEREGWIPQARKLVEAASRPGAATTTKKTSKAPVRKTSKKKASRKKAGTRKTAGKTAKKSTGKKTRKKTK